MLHLALILFIAQPCFAQKTIKVLATDLLPHKELMVGPYITQMWPCLQITVLESEDNGISHEYVIKKYFGATITPIYFRERPQDPWSTAKKAAGYSLLASAGSIIHQTTNWYTSQQTCLFFEQAIRRTAFIGCLLCASIYGYLTYESVMWDRYYPFIPETIVPRVVKEAAMGKPIAITHWWVEDGGQPTRKSTSDSPLQVATRAYYDLWDSLRAKMMLILHHQKK